MSHEQTTDLLGEGDPADVVGHKTMADGTHLPLRRDEAAAMLAEADRRQTERERTMPTEGDAIEALFDAWLRLKELGWREAIYCPKDGSWFNAVECGSTGIHRCHYSGQWPDGAWWVEDGGDLWPAHPTLFRRRNSLPLPIEMQDAMRKAVMPNNPKYAELTQQARKRGRL